MPNLFADDLLRHEALGTTALYRVVDVADQTVAVEVLSSPGLETGTTLRLTRRAAQAMARERARVECPASVRRGRSLGARLRLAR